MKSQFIKNLSAGNISFLVAIMVLLIAGSASAYPKKSAAEAVGGPWELVVKQGFEGAGLLFPITVEDENKPQLLEDVLPVLGSPIKVRLNQYLPDLVWEMVLKDSPAGAPAAVIEINGTDMQQNVLLSALDPAKRAMTSSIGGIAILELDSIGENNEQVKKLIAPGVIGVLSVWFDDSNKKQNFIVKQGDRIKVPGTKYKIEVEKYFPHYTVDRTTKEVTNRSEKPLNPAVKVIVNDGKTKDEQWLWSKFVSPHSASEQKIHMKFTDCDLGDKEGGYILVTDGKKSWMVFLKEGKLHFEKAELEKAYPFADKDYTFTIKEVRAKAMLDAVWKNGSEKLSQPAIVLTIEYNDKQEQMVMGLHKASHYKSDFGTTVLLFRQKQEVSEPQQ